MAEQFIDWQSLKKLKTLKGQKLCTRKMLLEPPLESEKACQ
ncbi:MAG: hypothetical protein K0S36_2368 [Nitrosospira multiformis]|jgi:hypothetical protein|nr:hypothetical protein [Nitrosospira multiformis]